MTARVGGGGLPTGWPGVSRPGGQGSKVYVLCAEPKEYKHFRPGTRPGGFGYPAGRIGDRGDREIVCVPNVYVPFLAPSLRWSGIPHFFRQLQLPSPVHRTKGETDKRKKKDTEKHNKAKEPREKRQIPSNPICTNPFNNVTRRSALMKPTLA